MTDKFKLIKGISLKEKISTYFVSYKNGTTKTFSYHSKNKNGTW